MQTYVAEISEILRAQRRDEEHLEQLEAEFSAILKDLAGVSFWIRNYKYIPIWIKTAYYALTTLSGAQTLGEEYLSLVQVSDAEGRLIPSIWRRLIFVFLHVFVPLLADASLLRLQRLINHADTRTFLGVELSNNRKARQTFAQIVEWTRTKGLPSLNRLHLAIFYLSGAYYNISKRVAGIEYISFRPQTNIRAFWIFRFLGWLTFLQTSVSVASWIGENLLGLTSSKERDFSYSEQYSEAFEDIDIEERETKVLCFVLFFFLAFFAHYITPWLALHSMKLLLEVQYGKQFP
ncbi:unnamed protein product [Toxocara canis]|uniref:RING-type E3 ubiquitin transferase n=1 Tax=Toxocara canis TaxID=6265 RepID=A0A183TX54_TOXCA|nr:unnamed protein product [Toxocara canis]